MKCLNGWAGLRTLLFCTSLQVSFFDLIWFSRVISILIASVLELPNMWWLWIYWFLIWKLATLIFLLVLPKRKEWKQISFSVKCRWLNKKMMLVYGQVNCFQKNRWEAQLSHDYFSPGNNPIIMRLRDEVQTYQAWNDIYKH